LQEITREVLTYLQTNPVLYVGMAFVAGFLAHKTVVREAGSAFVLSAIIGSAGLILGQFMLIYFGLKEYLEKIAEFRLFLDFFAAYIGSFVVATLIHFVKPL
jgi:uncharacterized membrane protein YeaQ/YmgE (transglycosylase-associated protein family)